MENKRLSQNKRLLSYLIEHSSITPDEAWRKLGIYRLSARIFDLREKGYNITTSTQTVICADGIEADVARYTLFI
ncbi:MAG: helix-turn-helix domain-containing protein [Bacteroidales bacterium]|nr:helix-turn-helix domain-containing protein [Bacteroidales bacterium]